VPADAIAVPGAGRFLMPGLADMHTHIPNEPGVTSGPSLLVLYLANGVTSILNQGDFSGLAPGWANQVRTGELAGPSVYTAKFARGSRDGNPVSAQVNSPGAAVNYVANAKRQGYQFIKMYNWVESAVYQALIREANRQGLAVIEHIPLDVGAPVALSSGQSMVSHAGNGSFFNTSFNDRIVDALVPNVVDLVLTNGTWVNTTLAVEKAVADVWGGVAAAEQAVFAQPGVEFAHQATIALWQAKLFSQRLFNPAGSVHGSRDPDLEFFKRYTKSFHDAGVRLLAGTDSLEVLLMAGFSMRDELLLMLEIGLSDFDAIETATRNPGDFIDEVLGLDESFGTIEIGKRADLLLLEADPLVDLNRIFDRRAGVMTRGIWYTEADLQALLETIRR